MTRQEELVQAACKKYPEWKEAQCHYIDGAHYADSHPYWISVKDRKPKLKYSDDTTKYSDSVIVTDGKYRISARWLYSTYGGWYGWFTDGDEELKDVTHWTSMPQLPKKEGDKE